MELALTLYAVILVYAILGSMIAFMFFTGFNDETMVAVIFFWPAVVLACVGIGIYKLFRLLYRGCLELIEEAINVLQEK